MNYYYKLNNLLEKYKCLSYIYLTAICSYKYSK